MSEDRMTTTSNMQDRNRTQDTPQQVRLREAKAEAANAAATQRHDPTDMASVIGRIEDALETVSQETLQLPSSEALATFLQHVVFAKAELQTLAEVERQRALSLAELDTTDKE